MESSYPRNKSISTTLPFSIFDRLGVSRSGGARLHSPLLLCIWKDVEVVLTELGDAVFSGNVSIRDVMTIARNLTQLNNALDISNTFQILYQLTPLTIEIKISIDVILLYIESHLTESDVAYINRDIVPISVLYSLRNGSGTDVLSCSLFDRVGTIAGASKQDQTIAELYCAAGLDSIQ